LGDRLPDDADELVLARRVTAEGRSRALVNGRSASVGDLRELAAPLVAFYGQHEHRRLTIAAAQLDLLDGFCGDGQARRRATCASAHARVRDLEGRLEALAEAGGARERELDLLAFELDEIDRVDPSEAEEAELGVERERLRHVEALRAASLGAAEAAAPEAGEQGAMALLAGAAAALDGVAGVDAGLDPLAERWRALALEAEDLAGELRRYGEGLEGDPARLDAVEERLAAVDRLKRKHGGAVAAVLEHAARCRERRDELAGAAASLEEVQAALAAARTDLAGAADALRDARRAAAPKLAGAVGERLGELAMEGAAFAVELGEREPGPAGADTVELLLAPNPGVPAAPVRETASGGELSRVMLAVLSVANEGGRAALIFDEVDAGIGGQTARAVGEALRGLSAGPPARQVVCITHLPQIASLGARHFSIAKDVTTEPARTTVTQLGDGEVEGELVRMLGADAGDQAARRHARELRRAA
jgi:DNA repair protein RecN (Recombination protein N)